MAEQPVLELRDISVRLGTSTILQHVNLAVRPGEFVAIVGPSGSGKSTILNVAAGLLAPMSGQAFFRGEPIRNVNTRAGYMTQDDTSLPWRTTFKNIALPLQILGRPRSVINAKVREQLRLLGLEEAAHLYPLQLSGGMRRRLLLGRSMIYEPDILLMDEPFAALDAQLRSEMHAMLLRVVRPRGQTVVFVTHDIVEAAVLADRVVVIGGPRPATIIAEHVVTIGPVREPEKVRFDPMFVQLERELYESLQIARETVEPRS